MNLQVVSSFLNRNHLIVCHLIHHHRETRTGGCRDGDGVGDGQALDKGTVAVGTAGRGQERGCWGDDGWGQQGVGVGRA